MKTHNTLSFRLVFGIFAVIFLAIASISGPSKVGAWNRPNQPNGHLNGRAEFGSASYISAESALSQPPAPTLASQSPTSEGDCTPVRLGDVALNVPSVEIQPIFRLNGFPFPGSQAGVAVFTLWASHNRDLFNAPQLLIGQTDQSPEPFRVIPGVYDVYYSWLSGTRIPRNELTRVLTEVRLESDGDLIIDVPVITIAGRKLHNGAPFNFEGAAQLSLRGINWPGEVPLGDAQSTDFAVSIIPGTYGFEYDWQQGVNFPNNRHAQVSQHALLQSVNDLELNVPSLVQTFEFRHNGSPFPDHIGEAGNIVLRRGEREEVLLGATNESPSTIRLITGTYDAHWRHLAGANVPNNSDGVFLFNFDPSGPSPRVIDVPSVVVSGSFLLNGEPTPFSPFENARIRLVVADSEDFVNLGETQFGTYQRVVIPGSYDLIYEHLTGGAILPINPRATLTRGWRAERSRNRNVDIPFGTYTGSFRLNGELFPAIEFERGEIYAVSLEGDRPPALLGSTVFPDFETRLVPGRYQPAYAHIAGAAIVPRNGFTTFGRVAQIRKGRDTSALLDVQAATLTVSYQHNGTPLPLGGPENVNVFLHRDLNSLQLFNSADGPISIVAMGGRFDLFYQYIAGSGLPRNLFMQFECWDLRR
jgi:hypothetical protein